MLADAPIIARLSAFGLAVAGLMAVTNVVMEVARKKATTGRVLVPAAFWCHIFDTLVFVLAWGYYRLRGYGFYVRGGGDLFGISGLHISPMAIFVVYELIDFLIHGLATWLFFKALQEAAMSTAVPFLSFTSVLIIPTGFVLLGELPDIAKLLGVLLTTVGSVMMHWRLFAVGWKEPVKAIYRDKGSRYMLYTAVLLAVLSPLDKKLSLMTDIYTQCVIFGVGMSVFFFFMARARREPLLPVLSGGIRWIALAGILDAATILLQFESYQYLDSVIVISIKRSGIVLAVVFGWLFFRERNIRDKLMASTMMFIGVSMLYFPLTTLQATATAAVTLILMALYMALVPPGPTVDLAEDAPQH
jgi:drug/metabolite transporter (DMT)-like permease